MAAGCNSTHTSPAGPKASARWARSRESPSGTTVGVPPPTYSETIWRPWAAAAGQAPGHLPCAEVDFLVGGRFVAAVEPLVELHPMVRAIRAEVMAKRDVQVEPEPLHPRRRLRFARPHGQRREAAGHQAFQQRFPRPAGGPKPEQEVVDWQAHGTATG